MENIAKSFCVLLDGIYQRDKEITALKERLEAWRAYGLQAREALGYIFEDKLKRLKSLNEL